MESQFFGQSGRYAILTHDHPFFHWDLLLEAGETAWTWRLREVREVSGERREPEVGPPAKNQEPRTKNFLAPQPSTLNPQLPLIIERIANHRLLYLNYEGPVSGDRGRVTRWDWGEYRITEETDLEFVVELSGQHPIWKIRLPKAKGS